MKSWNMLFFLVALCLTVPVFGAETQFSDNMLRCNAISKRFVKCAAPPRFYVSCGGPFQLCGLINMDTGELIIERKYEDISSFFSESLAVIKYKGRYGYVDEKGEVVIPARYDNALPFRSGLAAVKIKNKYGIIDKNGYMVIDPQFDEAYPITNQVILARNGPFINQSGLFHIHKGWITDQNYVIFPLAPESDLVWGGRKDKDNERVGIMRSDGTWLLEPIYSEPIDLNDGAVKLNLDPFIKHPGVKDEPKMGVVNKFGEVIIPFRSWIIDTVWSKQSSDFHITEAGKEGILDKNGQLIGGRLFEKVEQGGRDLPHKAFVDGQWKFLDKNGVLIEPDALAIEVKSCPSGRKFIRYADGYRLLVPAGKPRIDGLFEIEYGPNCDDILVIRNVVGSKNYGIVTTENRLIDGGFIFEHRPHFLDNGLAIINQSGKQGLINEVGDYLIPPIYDDIQPMIDGENDAFELMPPFKHHRIHIRRPLKDANGRSTYQDQFFLVRKNGFDLVLNDRGMPAPLPAKAAFAKLTCPGGLKFITRGGLWGLSDISGRIVISPQYRALQCFDHGVALAAIDDKKQWCPLEPDGTLHIDDRCKKSVRIINLSHYLPEPLSKDLYESTVLWNQRFLEYRAGLRNDPARLIGDDVLERGYIDWN